MQEWKICKTIIEPNWKTFNTTQKAILLCKYDVKAAKIYFHLKNHLAILVKSQLSHCNLCLDTWMFNSKIKDKRESKFECERM